MSETKIMRPSADEMEIIMQIYLMPETGAYKIAKSTPSSMDDLSENVLDRGHIDFQCQLSST